MRRYVSNDGQAWLEVYESTGFVPYKYIREITADGTVCYEWNTVEYTSVVKHQCKRCGKYSDEKDLTPLGNCDACVKNPPSNLRKEPVDISLSYAGFRAELARLLNMYGWDTVVRLEDYKFAELIEWLLIGWSNLTMQLDGIAVEDLPWLQSKT